MSLEEHIAELRAAARNMERHSIPGFSHVYAACEHMEGLGEENAWLRHQITALTSDKMRCNNCGGQMFQSSGNSMMSLCHACGIRHDWSNVAAHNATEGK